MSRCCRWVFTLNNFVPEDVTRLEALGVEAKYLVFGKETGESGTPHLQGFVIFPVSTRLAAAKRKVGERAHLEPARGSNQQASEYCKKDGDFQEFGSLPGPQGKTNRFEDLKKWVLEQPRKPSAASVASEFPSIFLQYGRVMEWIDLIYPVTVGVQGDLRPHQRDLEGMLEEDPDDRQIIFVVDPIGGTGKSFFIRYMLGKCPDDVQRLSVGKRDDLAYAIDESKRIFLFDVPRSQSEYLQYSVFESIKDRMIFSTKYQSRTKFLGLTHCVVFMNEEPDYNKLSADRYRVIRWNAEV